MPQLKYRLIYDDDGEPMQEGSKVLVNGEFEEIIHFNDDGEIEISGWSIYSEDIETVEHIPDNRFGEIEDSLIEGKG